MCKHLVETPDEEIVDLYMQGASLRLIGRMLNIPASTVRNRLIELRVPRRGRSAHRLTEEEIATLAELYEQGETLSELVSLVGCAPDTIRLALIERGVRMRPIGAMT